MIVDDEVTIGEITKLTLEAIVYAEFWHKYFIPFGRAC